MRFSTRPSSEQCRKLALAPKLRFGTCTQFISALCTPVTNPEGSCALKDIISSKPRCGRLRHKTMPTSQGDLEQALVKVSLQSCAVLTQDS